MAIDMHPVDRYVAARDSFKRGNKDKAAEDLSLALGSDKVTEPIKNNVDLLLKEGTMAHDVALRLLEAEIRR